MFPVTVLDGQGVVPEENIVYLVGRGGFYLRKKVGLVEATVPVPAIFDFEDVQPAAKLDVPRIPAHMLVMAYRFFRYIFALYGAESMLMIHYSEETESFLLLCPEQAVSKKRINYTASDRVEGYQLIGTIHSHCDGSAYHSSTDFSDECDFDGLHITLGHVNQPYFSFSASLVVNGSRFLLYPVDVVANLVEKEWVPRPMPVRSRRVVIHCSSSVADDHVEGISSTDICRPVTTDEYEDVFWNVALPPGKDYRHYPFPESWLDQVIPIEEETEESADEE